MSLSCSDGRISLPGAGVFLQAVPANAFVVTVDLLHLVARQHSGRGAAVGLVAVFHVIDFPAAFAEEMGVRFPVGIVACILFVNRQRLDRSLFAEQPQRVVDRGLGEGRNGRRECGVDVIHRRMGTMLHQVVHDGYPLDRQLDVVFL